MKIGILSTIELYPWAGTEEVWFHFARHAMQSGHAVCLGAHTKVAGSAQVAELQREGLQVAARQPYRPMRLYLAMEKLRSQMGDLLKFQPDVLLVNAGSLADVINLPYLKQFCDACTCPVVLFVHFNSDRLHLPRTALRQWLPTLAGIVFVSDHNRQLAERQLALDFSKAAVVMNSSRFLPPAVLPMPADTTARFACVARLETYWKAQDILIQVLAQPHWRQRDWSLDFYGDGPDRQLLQDLIDHYRIGDKIRLAGYERDLERLWSGHHLHILTSHAEGTPLSVIEAMACGRPNLVTDAGGNFEILDPATAFLAPAATPRAVDAALNAAWQARDQWTAIGQRAHAAAAALASRNPPASLLAFLQSCTNR